MFYLCVCSIGLFSPMNYEINDICELTCLVPRIVPQIMRLCPTNCHSDYKIMPPTDFLMDYERYTVFQMVLIFEYFYFDLYGSVFILSSFMKMYFSCFMAFVVFS